MRHAEKGSSDIMQIRAIYSWLKQQCTWVVLSTVIAGWGVLSPCSSAQSEQRPLVWHLHTVKDYIFVDGEVDGKSGVFMFDTGTPFRFLLNRHYAPLGNGADVVKGTVTSGQGIDLQSHGSEHRVLIDGHPFSAAAGAKAGSASEDNALSGDFDFIEKNVAPRFLGFVGWGVLKNYSLVLDYQRRLATLYPIGADGQSMQTPAQKTNIVAVIHFAPSDIPTKGPEPFYLEIGGIKFASTIDSGGVNEIEASKAIWDQLKTAGLVKPAQAKDETCVAVSGVQYEGRALQIPNIQMKVGEEARVSLGSVFLRKYLSIWNPIQRTVTLVRAAPMAVTHDGPCS